MHYVQAFSDITEWMKTGVSCKNRQWLVSCMGPNPEKKGERYSRWEKHMKMEGRSYRERETAGKRWASDLNAWYWCQPHLTLQMQPGCWFSPGSDDPRAYWYWKSKYSFAMLPDYYFLITPELLIAAPQFSFSSYFTAVPVEDGLWVGWVPIGLGSLSATPPVSEQWHFPYPPWDRQTKR